MPLQNRVTPLGELIADPAAGSSMGIGAAFMTRPVAPGGGVRVSDRRWFEGAERTRTAERVTSEHRPRLRNRQTTEFDCRLETGARQFIVETFGGGQLGDHRRYSLVNRPFEAVERVPV